MASISDHDGDGKTGFRLSMLLNDTRYRSLTFQFIALVLVIAAIAWLTSNLLSNLADLGQDISYDYLGQPANYDINQQPIPFTSQDTHMRAAVVGVLNTLIVAILGCITATLLGVTAGVLRLSNNWLIARLMSVYVEAFRNVPVLIWILIIFFVMAAALPPPSAFRGADPESSMLLNAFAFTNRGIYVPRPVPGAGAMAVLAVFVLSVIGVFAYRRFATKRLYETGQLLPMGWPSAAILILPTALVWLLFSTTSNAPVAVLAPEGTAEGLTLAEAGDIEGGATLCAVRSQPATALAKREMNAAGVRFRTAEANDPASARAAFEAGDCSMLIVSGDEAGQIAAATVTLTTDLRAGHPFELETPYLAGFNFTDGMQVRGSLIALWFALAIYTGAFIAENVRAGILAVARGQTEAAASLGLRPKRIMNLVILPQALRVIIPPVISHYLNLTKNSSLAIAVGYMDITGTLGGITLNQTGRAIESILLLMLFYLVISLTISALGNAYNPGARDRRLQVGSAEPLLLDPERAPDACLALCDLLGPAGIPAVVPERGLECRLTFGMP